MLYFWGKFSRNFSCSRRYPCVTLLRAEKSLKALKKEADDRLLIEAAQRDPARFAELYENNFERVYAYVLRRVGDRVETEDVTSQGISSCAGEFEAL